MVCREARRRSAEDSQVQGAEKISTEVFFHSSWCVQKLLILPSHRFSLAPEIIRLGRWHPWAAAEASIHALLWMSWHVPGYSRLPHLFKSFDEKLFLVWGKIMQLNTASEKMWRCVCVLPGSVKRSTCRCRSAGVAAENIFCLFERKAWCANNFLIKIIDKLASEIERLQFVLVLWTLAKKKTSRSARAWGSADVLEIFPHRASAYTTVKGLGVWWGMCEAHGLVIFR